jgi:hypothetical protein
MFHNPSGGAMKRWLAVLGVLLAGALLLPQHAWSQGAIVNDGLQINGTPPNIYLRFNDGSNTGTLEPADTAEREPNLDAAECRRDDHHHEQRKRSQWAG